MLKQNYPKLFPGLNRNNGPIVRYEKKGYQDLISQYMPKIEKIEEMSVADYKKKVESQENPAETEENKKITPTTTSGPKEAGDSEKVKKMLFSPDRFKMKKNYQMNAKLNTENIINFITNCENDTEKPYFNNHNLREKFAKKIVGDDFEHMVYKNNKNIIILFEKPQHDADSSKIRNLYDKIVKNSDKNETEFCRYNVVNESPVFRYGGPIPAIGVFTKNNKGNPVYLDLAWCLRKGLYDEEFLQNEIHNFLNKHII